MTRQGALARRVAVAALIVLGLQLGITLVLQGIWVAQVREYVIVQLTKGLDEVGALDECERRPGPWTHRHGWWSTWPVDAQGRPIGGEPPVARVRLPEPGSVEMIRVPGPDLVVYASEASGCSAVVVRHSSSMPLIGAMSSSLIGLFGLRILVLLVAAGALVAVTAVPLVRRINRLAARTNLVVANDFVGEVQDGSPDEIGELADAFDAAARTARERLLRLEHRDEVLRRALADLAHDLRTPLATLKLSVSSLPASKAVSSIRAELNFLEGMTQNFESLLGGADATEETVALAGLVDRLRHRFTPLAVERGLSFEVAVPDESPTVQANATALEQAVGNLVHNALRWASGHVVLVLFTTADEGMAGLGHRCLHLVLAPDTVTAGPNQGGATPPCS
ncbi:MAG: HAMP domain-containing sensor histidine kinase [Myxococcota bacterium]